VGVTVSKSLKRELSVITGEKIQFACLRGALYEMGSKIRFFFIALIDRYII